MVQSPDAIRYIDPTWNKSSPNGLLYPSILYFFGAKRSIGSENEQDYVKQQGNSEDDASTDSDS